MRLVIRKKDLELTENLEAYIEQKIVAPAKRRIQRIEGADEALLEIEISRTTHHHHKGMVYKISAILTVGGKLFRAEAVDQDIWAACDALESELTREIVSFKDRSFSLFKRVARRVKDQLRFERATRFFRRERRK